MRGPRSDTWSARARARPPSCRSRRCRLAAALPDDSAELHWAARLVGGPRPELLHYLLGRVGVVPHLDLAETLWRRNGVVATYVTRSGEVLSPTGRLVGRSSGQRAAGQ